MLKWIITAIVLTVDTGICLLLSWEAKRYYANNRSRILAAFRAFRDEWRARSREDSSK